MTEETAQRSVTLTLDEAALARLRRAAALRAAARERPRRTTEAPILAIPGLTLSVDCFRRRLSLASGAEADSTLELGALRLADGGERPWRRWTLTAPTAEAANVAALIRACRLGDGARLSFESCDGHAAALAAPSPTAQRGPAIGLRPDMSAGAALACILQSCLVHWTGNLSGVIWGVPEAVHQARVGLRRQRAAIALFKTTAPPPPPDGLLAGLRGLAGALGDARDWDVFLMEIMPPPRRVGGAGADYDGVQAAALARLSAGRARAAAAASGSAAFDAALSSWVWIAQLAASPTDSDACIADVVPSLLDRRWRQARRRGRIYESLSDDSRHEFRIYLKKLRYGVDFFQSLLPFKRVRKDQAALGALLDGLGALNDMATARRLLADILQDPSADMTMAYAAGVIAGWHDDASERRARRVGRLWRVYDAGKPCWR